MRNIQSQRSADVKFKIGIINMQKIKMTVDGHEVWLTDDPKEAFTYQKTVPVIGICTPGQDKSWSGISFLAED